MKILMIIGGLALCGIILTLLRPLYRKGTIFSYKGKTCAWDKEFVAVAKKIGLSGSVIVALNTAPAEEKIRFAAQAETEGLPLEAAMARFIASAALKKHHESIRAKKHKAAAAYSHVGEAAARYADTIAPAP